MIIVAIGSNLSSIDGRLPLLVCRDAVQALSGLPGLRLLRRSRWYLTAPVPVSDQPDYVNGVVALDGEIAPHALLASLQELEHRAGRQRSSPNAARVLDLDVIAMGETVRDAPDPVLPHPRAHERAFVLFPLRDVVPGWRHPRLHRTVDDLIAALPPQQIRVLN